MTFITIGLYCILTGAFYGIFGLPHTWQGDVLGGILMLAIGVVWEWFKSK